jgi:small ligand-binding sensory domain FIST
LKWASAVSTAPRLDLAVVEAARSIWDQLQGIGPDLVLAFVSPHYRADWSSLPGLLAGQFPEAARLGCSAGGVIGDQREIESGAALALTAAWLPGVELSPFLLSAGEEPEIEAAAEVWRQRLGCEPGDTTHTVLLPDPFTADVPPLLKGLEQTFSTGTITGGLVSGGRKRGQSLLLVEDELGTDGTAGIALRGNIEVDTIVSQGCRPIGNPMFVTSCSGPLIMELDGLPPTKVLQDLFEEISSAEQELIRDSLFIGSVMYDDRIEYHRGDFLVRNIVGFDPGSGALAVNTEVSKGQVIQFHVRDAETSAEDLEELLAAHQSSSRPAPAGALLFSCLGRGSDLYGHPSHDSNAFHRHLGPVPLTGFFCNGEIGPVGGHTFLHGYTSAFALIRSGRSRVAGAGCRAAGPASDT